MAANTTTSTLDSALKELLPSKKLQYIGFEKNPALAMIPKMTKMGGRKLRVPVWFGGNQGISAQFAAAQAAKTGGLYEDFEITRRKRYGLTSLELEAIYASDRDEYAFLKAREAEVTQLTRNVSNDLGWNLFRSFGGSRGQVGSTSTLSLTLKVTDDIVNFAQGMSIVSDDLDGTTGGGADAEIAVISAVDIDTGIIKRTDANWTAGGNFSNNDFLFRSGDFSLSMNGFDDWVPATSPSATLFNTVDRSVDPVRLGGVRHDANVIGQSTEEALIDAATKLDVVGGNPDIVFMHPYDYSDLRKSLGSRLVYDRATSTDARISFRAVVLTEAGSGNGLKVLTDRNCQRGVAWMMQLDTWELCTLGEAPRMLEVPGQNSVIFHTNEDAVEIRTGLYGNLACHAPGYNARIKLAQ